MKPEECKEVGDVIRGLQQQLADKTVLLDNCRDSKQAYKKDNDRLRDALAWYADSDDPYVAEKALAEGK